MQTLKIEIDIFKQETKRTWHIIHEINGIFPSPSTRNCIKASNERGEHTNGLSKSFNGQEVICKRVFKNTEIDQTS